MTCMRAACRNAGKCIFKVPCEGYPRSPYPNTEELNLDDPDVRRACIGDIEGKEKRRAA
jgi:hypothetical protein